MLCFGFKSFSSFKKEEFEFQIVNNFVEIYPRSIDVMSVFNPFKLNKKIAHILAKAFDKIKYLF
jgi:hypothetical protein